MTRLLRALTAAMVQGLIAELAWQLARRIRARRHM
jgi:hypothetical protein